MNEIITQSSSAPSPALPLPEPKFALSIRPGILADIPFLDSLQKMHTKQVGWMPTAQFEGKIKLGHVLIAEEVIGPSSLVIGSDSLNKGQVTNDQGRPVGYLIGNDQYFKHDDIGIIYQLNVAPGKQRGFVGASLLKAQFDRSAYGCKLYCCWCAQDIAANHFWESMGFVALAFRTGSRNKGKDGTPRVHIFWQKRIRPDDTTTAWWFPSQTSGGSIREDRLVLPIPPGTHWSEAKPIVLPGSDGPRQIENATPRVRSASKPAAPAPRAAGNILGAGFIRFAPATPAKAQTQKAPKPKREKLPKQKNDPKFIAAARELRDRYLEEINRDGHLLSSGKYDVARQIADRSTADRSTSAPAMKQLAA